MRVPLVIPENENLDNMYTIHYRGNQSLLFTFYSSYIAIVDSLDFS